MLTRPRLSTSLALLMLHLPLLSAEGPRVFPLWDGKEAISSYAKRVNLPATKSIDLGGGVALELVLIPAGQFIMGSEEPAKPTVTVADANWLIALGGGAAALLLLVLAIKSIRKRQLSFSLRFLLLMTMSLGLCLGGFARRQLALQEAARYDTELVAFNALQSYEKPAHSVTLTQPFYMGKYTVMQEQYSAIMKTNPSNFKGAQLPVETVSWDAATAFCKKLNKLLKDKSLEALLPTEAQWEYACRAGTRTRFYTGDSDSDMNAAGWNASNSGGTTHTVGQLKANAFGLYDMHGNVWQWCEDSMREYIPTMTSLQNPTGPTQESARVLRGGSWGYNPRLCRSAYRLNLTPGLRDDGIGFRVVDY